MKFVEFKQEWWVDRIEPNKLMPSNHFRFGLNLPDVQSELERARKEYPQSRFRIKLVFKLSFNTPWK